ncbi:MAG: DUF4831 family protein [Bacteroidales bacterium]
MKNIKLFTLILGIFISLGLSAQITEDSETIPEGVMVYSLPMTTLHIKVDAVKETYIPGPYASYAKKYLGKEFSSKVQNTCNIKSININRYLEADPSLMIMLDPQNSAARKVTKKFTSQGLILLKGNVPVNTGEWRFANNENSLYYNGSELTPNYTSTQTTLYKQVKNSQGTYDKVSVNQSQIVEKNTENKASECASMIYLLRKKRLEIITGDTDASFSGEALTSAIAEINRLEAEYVKLFIGRTETSEQILEVDICPSSKNDKQYYIAFRISDEDGLLNSDDVSGRPIVLQLIPQRIENPAKLAMTEDELSSITEPINIKKKGRNIYYRIPSICQLKLINGNKVLLNTRVPIYQLGQMLSFPLDKYLE